MNNNRTADVTKCVRESDLAFMPPQNRDPFWSSIVPYRFTKRLKKEKIAQNLIFSTQNFSELFRRQPKSEIWCIDFFSHAYTIMNQCEVLGVKEKELKSPWSTQKFINFQGSLFFFDKKFYWKNISMDQNFGRWWHWVSSSRNFAGLGNVYMREKTTSNWKVLVKVNIFCSNFIFRSQKADWRSPEIHPQFSCWHVGILA